MSEWKPWIPTADTYLSEYLAGFDEDDGSSNWGLLRQLVETTERFFPDAIRYGVVPVVKYFAQQVLDDNMAVSSEETATNRIVTNVVKAVMNFWET